MKKVIVGLSGGVDSSVACYLLLQQGYEVEGLFMRNWDSAANSDFYGNPNVDAPVCPQEEDYMDALKVAEHLGIKLHRCDFVEEYWENVFSYFLNEYKKGRTPNPDIMCNKYIKFDSFLKKALEIGADYIAMGHYAIREEKDGIVYLKKGIDSNKDQTYFLCMLKEEQIAKTLFPIGEMLKSEVRELAKKINLPTALKKDSTGICFIGERNFSKFLSNYLPAQKGDIVTIDGAILGTHEGLMNYTIGQRKGIGIGGLNDFAKEPWFVIGKDLEKNELIVGQGFHNELLYSNRCIIEDLNLFYGIEDYNNLTAKFRYRAKDVKIKLELLDNNEALVIYDEKERAVTPGQACVIYDGDICLGGGIIKEVYMNDIKRKY